MAQFTQLGLSGKPEAKASQVTIHDNKQGFVGKQTVAVFAWSLLTAGLLGIFLLETSGCSREKSKIESPVAQNSMSQAALSPVSAAPTVAEAPASTPAPKKVVHRVTSVAYDDATYGVSFRYPKRYTLKTADTTKDATKQDASKQDAAKQDATAVQPFDMNFAQPGGVQLASVVVPKGAYRGTDLTSASFNVSVNQNSTPEACSQFALLQPGTADQPQIQGTKLRLSGMDLEAVEAISGPADKQQDAKYYHTFANGACYEFVLNMTTADPGDDETVKSVDRDQVFRNLRAILATVKINPVAPAEATTAAAPVTPEQPAPAPVAASADQQAAAK
jgi:hypothetical protein